jgi:hypothetical protein
MLNLIFEKSPLSGDDPCENIMVDIPVKTTLKLALILTMLSSVRPVDTLYRGACLPVFIY